MSGIEAVNLMLTHDNIEHIMLLGSAKNRKRIINKKDLPLSGLFINAMELNSDRWMVCLALESDLPGKMVSVWKYSVN